MLWGRFGVLVLTSVAAAFLVPDVGVARLHAQISRPCQAAAAAQRHGAGCYLLTAALVRRPSGNQAETSVPDPIQPPEAIVPATTTKDTQSDADRTRSNQLTIIGWIACVFLFAKGIEFALSDSFKWALEDEVGRIRPPAAVAAIAVCMAAVIFFVLLTLQGRQTATPAKTYNSLSECLHDAQTVDQIRECGTNDYS